MKIKITEQDVNYMALKVINRLAEERDIYRHLDNGDEEFEGSFSPENSERYQVNITPEDAIREAAEENPELEQEIEEYSEEIPLEFGIDIIYSYDNPTSNDPSDSASLKQNEDYDVDPHTVELARQDIEGYNLPDDIKQILLAKIDDIEENPENYIDV